MTRTFLKRAMLTAAILASGFASTAEAQTQAGTTITNTASATYTDANGNTYAGITSNTVTVRVGFVAAISVTQPGALTPAAPSTGNEVTFPVVNGGNGNDIFTIGPVTPSAEITITGYRIGAVATVHATLAALNAALATDSVSNAAGSNSRSIVVVYDVSATASGTPRTILLTASSVRDATGAARTDNKTATINAAASPAAIAVTPDEAAGVFASVPANTTGATTTFVLTNNGGTAGTYNITTAPGANVTITGITGTGFTSTGAGTGTIAVNPGAGGAVTLTVTYNVAQSTAAANIIGVNTGVQLTATHSTTPADANSGNRNVRITGAAVAITKAAVTDASGTDVALTEQRPNVNFAYRITVTNSGTAAATNVVVTDNLDSRLTFVSSTAGAAAGQTHTHTIASLAAGATVSYYIVVRINP